MRVDLDAYRGIDAAVLRRIDRPAEWVGERRRTRWVELSTSRLEECAPILKRQNAREISVSHRRCPVSFGTMSGASTATTAVCAAKDLIHASISTSVRTAPDWTSRPVWSSTAMPVLALEPHAKSMPTKDGGFVVTRQVYGFGRPERSNAVVRPPMSGGASPSQSENLWHPTASSTDLLIVGRLGVAVRASTLRQPCQVSTRRPDLVVPDARPYISLLDPSVLGRDEELEVRQVVAAVPMSCPRFRNQDRVLRRPRPIVGGRSMYLLLPAWRRLHPTMVGTRTHVDRKFSPLAGLHCHGPMLPPIGTRRMELRLCATPPRRQSSRNERSGVRSRLEDP
jgi:hypothetical protein